MFESLPKTKEFMINYPSVYLSVVDVLSKVYVDLFVRFSSFWFDIIMTY